MTLLGVNATVVNYHFTNKEWLPYVFTVRGKNTLGTVADPGFLVGGRRPRGGR